MKIKVEYEDLKSAFHNWLSDRERIYTGRWVNLSCSEIERLTDKEFMDFYDELKGYIEED